MIGLALPAAARADTFSFSNTTAIQVPSAGTGPAEGNPYPSTIAVSGLAGTVTNVQVKLSNVTHGFMDDIDAVLLGPNGQHVMLMSDACQATPGAQTYTFDDSAPASLPDNASTCAAGTYKPSNYNGGDEPENFSAPGPNAPHASALSSFNGASPNGTWSLFIKDDQTADTGSINGGWTLTLTRTVPAAAPPAAGAGVPSNQFSFGKVTTKTNGQATLQLNAPGPGKFTITDKCITDNTCAAPAPKSTAARKKKKRKALIKSVTLTIAQAGTVKVRIKPTSTANKILAKKRRVTVNVAVTFTPNGGAANTKTKSITLKRPRKGKKRRR